MNKPELLVTPVSVNDILPLIEAGADAFVVGEQRYGLRLAGEFSREEIKERSIHSHMSSGKKVYVAMNALFHNEKVSLNLVIIFIFYKLGVDAVIFGDPSVLLAAREAAPDMKLHWSTPKQQVQIGIHVTIGDEKEQNVRYFLVKLI